MLARFGNYSYLCGIALVHLVPAQLMPLGGERSYFMRKTFSNVCRCVSRISQIPNPQQTDDNETSTWSVSIYLNLIYSSFWRGLSALSILCGLGDARAFDTRMDRRTDTYAFFVS